MIWTRDRYGEPMEFASLMEAAIHYRDAEVGEPVIAVEVDEKNAARGVLPQLVDEIARLEREDAEEARHQACERRMLG